METPSFIRDSIKPLHWWMSLNLEDAITALSLLEMVSGEYVVADSNSSGVNTSSSVVARRGKSLGRSAPSSSATVCISNDGLEQRRTKCLVRSYSGQRSNFNECAPDPCKNGATCTNLRYAYSCTCITGWKGYNCDQDITECDPAPCENGATCTNLQNAYSCVCSPGWQGNNCDQDINECDPAPCENGATCTNLQNAYSCVCSPGWQGNNCDQDINECDPAPCKNGATCSNLQNAYSCVCSSGWQGNNCDQAGEDKEQSSTNIWIATTLALCLLIVGVTTTACLCIRREKEKRAQIAAQLNELQPSDIPLELINSNSGNFDVFPNDNNDDNTDHYDVLPDDNNDDNTDHYDVLPDDVHDDCVVPYAVVPLDNTEREATPMFRSLQSQITDDYLHTGLGESSYMIPASSYVLGRICESETSVQTHSAVVE
ncbi:protein jagged-1b-like [Dreissena polymorpha]|nr:protein jagged-1b-like [Dreissena polymorpha]